MAVSECQPQPGPLEHAARAIRQIGVVGLPDGLGREMRMDVDGNIELHRARQQRLVAGMVEKAAVGGAVDERTEEAQFPDRANEFARCRIRRLHRQHGKAREPRRMARHGRRQMVVHLARNRDAVRTGHEVGAGPGVREHLQGDAGLIHRLQAPFADLGQQVDRIGAGLWSLPRLKAAPADRVAIDPADQGRHREMFLQRNNSHGIRDPSGLALPTRIRLLVAADDYCQIGRRCAPADDRSAEAVIDRVLRRTEDVKQHSRGAISRPGFASSVAPSENRGRRECRALAAPAGLVC